MKLNLRFTTNNYIFIGFIIILVGILALINNFYFYDHVKRSAERNAFQLKAILVDEIEFCRKNRISGIRYRENMKAIIKNFAKNAYYNDTIVLKHEDRGVLWEKPIVEWDKTVASHVEIILPKLKSDNHLYYDVNVKFDGYLYFISVIRSMTFSIFDKGAKLFYSLTVTENERKAFYALQEKLDKYKSVVKDFNKLVGKKYKNALSDDEKKLYSDLQHKLLMDKLSDAESERYEILKSKIINPSDAKIALLRSRPVVGFTIFAIILALLFRHRELQRIEIEKELEKEKKNKEILETNFGITEQNDDMDLYDAVIKNDISKLKNIKSVNPTMNIIKFNAMVDHTEEEKLRILEVLIEKGIDLNFHDEDGMTALMYYAIGNINNEKDSKIIETLTENGIDINAQNKSGMTALMLCSVKNRPASVQILINNGADINIRHNLTAKELAATEEIRSIIRTAENHTPQKLVQMLSQFTLEGPMKYTAHEWDSNKYYDRNFNGYMDSVKKQFEVMESELQELSLNLYEKIRVFLIEENPAENYSWCSKTPMNIGWSNLEGLKEWCDSGNNPFDFKLPKPIYIGRKQIVTFGEVINLFKQEIEMRADFKNLEQIFLSQNIKIDLSTAKIHSRQFYTDTQKFSSILSKIFGEMNKREDFIDVKVTTTELEDRSIEIKITQVDSYANKNANAMLQEVEDGDFADIKESLTNLCDWSIESCYEDENFRVNFLHSNNVKDIEMLDTRPKGFTHILRFYK